MLSERSNTNSSCHYALEVQPNPTCGIIYIYTLMYIIFLLHVKLEVRIIVFGPDILGSLGVRAGGCGAHAGRWVVVFVFV